MSQKILLVGGCGYIGNFLYSQLINSNKYEVDVCDHLARGNPARIPVKYHEYIDISREELSGYRVILWFAGHSSVQLAVTDPEGAIKNNCLNFFEFAQKINTSKTKLIYASTGSLYSMINTDNIIPTKESELIHIPDQNPYDISKFAFDYLATHFLKNIYSLRMGTLAGYSDNIRRELLFNAMNISASENGYVTLKNKDSFRTILFLDDLWLLIEKLISADHEPGVYNTGSFSGRIGEFAEKIAKIWGADVKDEGNSKTYSFLLNTEKMWKTIGTVGTNINFNDYSKKLITSLQIPKP